MATIQWWPAVNALTTPSSCNMLFVQRNVVDSAEDLRIILAMRNKGHPTEPDQRRAP